MRDDINLSGSEIAVLKTLGLTGTPMPGRILIDRMNDFSEAEFIDTLAGLLTLGYVLSNTVNVRKLEDVERAVFRSNPAHAPELRDATNPARARARAERATRQRRRRS